MDAARARRPLNRCHSFGTKRITEQRNIMNLEVLLQSTERVLRVNGKLREHHEDTNQNLLSLSGDLIIL